MDEFVFEVQQAPSGGVAVKVDTEKVVLVDKDDEAVWGCELAEIKSVSVDDDTVVQINVAGEKTRFEFLEEELELFIEVLITSCPEIVSRILWKGKVDQVKQRAMTIDREMEVMDSYDAFSKQLVDDDQLTVLDDSDEDSTDEESNSEQGEDESEDADQDVEFEEQVKEKSLPKKSSKLNLRAEERRRRSPTLEERKRMMVKSLNGTEWATFTVTRFNRFGQPEPCTLLISPNQLVFEILSMISGQSVGVYQLQDIYSVAFSENGVSIRAKHKEQLQTTFVDESVKEQTLPAKRGTIASFATSGSSQSASSSLVSRMSIKRNQRKSALPPSLVANNRRSTVSFLGMLKGSKKTTLEKPRAVTENLVFESKESGAEFLKLVTDLVPNVQVIPKTIPHNAFTAGWTSFQATLLNKGKTRFLLVNPILGCLFVFKTKVTRNGIVADGKSPKIGFRLVSPLAYARELPKKGPHCLSVEFHGIVINEADAGVPKSGSFDPILSGLLDPSGTCWCMRQLQNNGELSAVDPSQVSQVKISVDMHSFAECTRFKACLESFVGFVNAKRSKVAERNSHKPRRKSSIAARLVRVRSNSKEDAAKNEIPRILAAPAVALHNRAWTEVDTRPFFTEHKIFIGTFNVGDASPPKSAVLEHWIPSPAHVPEKAGGSMRKKHTTTCTSGAQGRYSMYVIGFQEVSARFDEWNKALAAHFGKEYKTLVSVRLWEIGLVIFIKASELTHVSHVTTAAEKTGIRIAKSVTGVQLGNKGGVGVGFRWHDVPIAFINAHLSAQQNKVAERNNNFTQIMKKLGLSTMPANVNGVNLEPTHAFEHVFFFGDLNYRVDMDFKDAEKACIKKDWASLHATDQLERERKAGRAFHGFHTEWPMFAPTYRWKRNKQELSNKKGQPPSYTDRVLWHSRPGLAEEVSMLSYGSAANLMISDHRPVAATFSLKVRHKYSWPFHPLTEHKASEMNAGDSKSQQEQQEQKQHQPHVVGQWMSPRGDFFITPLEAKLPSAPEVRLKNVTLHLHAQEQQRLPSWVRLLIASPILHHNVITTFSPGSETKPELVAGSLQGQRYAYEGVGQWGDLYYRFEHDVGIPKITPVLWDPIYLRSQALVVQLQPCSSKEEASLSGMHAAQNDNTGKDDEQPYAQKAKPFSADGQCCIPLKHVFESLARVANSSGRLSWNTLERTAIPFSEPVVLGGCVVGRLYGDLALKPPKQVINPVLYELEKSEEIREELEATVLLTGYLQLAVLSPTPSSSVRVYAVLNSLSGLSVFSEKTSKGKKALVASRNLLFRLNIASCEISKVDDSETPRVQVLNCLRVQDGVMLDIDLAFESKSDLTNWIDAMDEHASLARATTVSSTTGRSIQSENFASRVESGEFVHIGQLPPPPTQDESTEADVVLPEEMSNILASARGLMQ